MLTSRKPLRLITVLSPLSLGLRLTCLLRANFGVETKRGACVYGSTRQGPCLGSAPTTHSPALAFAPLRYLDASSYPAGPDGEIRVWGPCPQPEGFLIASFPFYPNQSDEDLQRLLVHAQGMLLEKHPADLDRHAIAATWRMVSREFRYTIQAPPPRPTWLLPRTPVGVLLPFVPSPFTHTTTTTSHRCCGLSVARKRLLVDGLLLQPLVRMMRQSAPSFDGDYGSNAHGIPRSRVLLGYERGLAMQCSGASRSVL